ncbi:MAG TPA: GTPase Era [Bacillota bacterium]|nr:GTPase Era [Bacillota bacterium]
MERGIASFKSGFVALLGRTNVGKSTLLNSLVGKKVVIVSDKPQTTRNRILCVLTREDSQVIFLDTPGIHKPKHKLGDHLVKVALKTLKGVDVVLFLVEAQNPPGPGDRFTARQLEGVDTPVLLVINKIDLIRKDQLLLAIDRYRELYRFAEIIPVSALKGDNLAHLLEIVKGYLPPGPKYYPDDMLTDKPESFIVAEIIREKILNLTEQEVPHSVAVVVEQMEERPGNVVFINALIYTEKDSQKKILIGKGGQMLKKIGQAARENIEGIFGTKVYIELWVKVKPDWRNKEAQLYSFGYREKE